MEKNIAWDQIISKENEKLWNTFANEWPMDIKKLSQFVTIFSKQIQIHVFTDASTAAYSAAMYSCEIMKFKKKKHFWLLPNLKSRS